MSTSVSTAFVAQYEAEAHEVFQREGSQLLPAVRQNTVNGTTATFQVIGKGTATTKARNGAITPMNQSHTTAVATMADFYAGDWHDKLDESKIKHDERGAIVRGGAYALGRKVDDQILTSLDGTTQTTVSLTLSSKANILASMLTWTEALFSNDIPNDGQNYGLISQRLWSQLMTVQEFQSADWVGPSGLPLTEGVPLGQRWKAWAGVMWKAHTGLSGVKTATCKGFVWNKMAVGYGWNGRISADITWHGDRAAWFLNNMMSGGSVLIEDVGVIEANWDDTAAVATS